MKRLTFIMLALLAIAGRVSAKESVSVNGVTGPQGGEAFVEINHSLEGAGPYENFNFTTVELDNVSFDVTSTATMGDPIEALAIDDIKTYTGSEPYVYSKANMTYYALNSLGEYEEYGLYSEVSTLKVAAGGISEIEYLKSPSGAYINLNYIPKANSKAICTMVAETGSDWKAAYGCGYYQNGWKDRFCFFTTNATINLGGETGDKNQMRYGEKIVTVLDAVAGKMDIFEADGTTLIGTIYDSPKTADCKTPLYVFAQNKDVPGGGTQTDCQNPLVTIYGLQLYEGETLVMDLVPAVNGEGKGGLKDKLTGTFYGSANSAEFELSADGQAMAGQAGIPVYEGKRVKLTTDNHEYKYQNGEWLDCGEMALEEITDTAPSYKDMRNWKTNDSHMSIFAGFTYDGTTNEINPFVGTGGHEPYMFKIETIAGQDYNWSFTYSGSAYNSWHSTEFHAYVANDYNLSTTETGANYNDNVIGIAEAFPFAGVENKAYSIDFTAKQNNETLVVQFGDVDDDDKGFWFKFANLKVSKCVYPLAYEPIDFVVQDNNKYTPLAYIESTGAVRENAFTLPYNPKTATQIDAKFQVYDTSTGWSGIFSARNIYAGTGISLYMNGNDRAHFGYFTGDTTGDGDNFAPFSLNTDYEVTADVTKLVINGKEYPTGNTFINATTRNLSLFANPEWDNPMRGRFYYCKISEASEVIYDFKPVMRHDGVFGFYDHKTTTFVLPAKGNWDGYGFATLDDQSYVYFPENKTLIVGSSEKFEPTVQNIDGATFTWTSSDENIATVAADGTVTGVAKGTATITATTDADQGWTASYVLSVEPAGIATDNVEVWDGTSDAIVGSIRWGGDQYKPAYTITFDSGEDFGDWSTSNPKYNVICGVPEVDENNKAWYEVDYKMTSVSGSIWSYNNTVLPSSWPSNPGEVYVRRYFKAEGKLPAQLYMPAPHDDAPCEYYINGTLVWARTGFEPGVNGWYEDEVVKLNDEQRALIKTDGSVNVFAYHVHQNWGGRYADGGIYGNSLADNSPCKTFESNENAKRLANAVAQAENVTGFPADVLEYCQKATVCMQDINYALDLVRFELRKALSPRHDFDFASAEPADGLECYLFNVGAGQFLCGSNDWGTHASVEYNISSWPMILHANTSGENRYSIQTNLPNGLRGKNDGLGHNGYVDCEYGADFTTSEVWAWTFEPVGNGNYRIIQSETDRYLGMTEDERYQVDTDKTGADNLYNQWKVVTGEQLEALAAAATTENPADVSYYIHQNTFSQNDFDGDDKGGANADLNDSKWDCNAGSIWDWKSNDVGGDYIYEMWNTASVGKVYLKQMLEGLPAGQYYAECTGFYRDGNWDAAMAGNTRQLAYIYAGSKENSTLLPSIMDGANKGAGYGRLGEPVIPDQAAQAPRFFKLGTYTVQTPVVTVGADGKLEIGVYRDAEDVKDGDWIVVDNFRLYCVGQTATDIVTKVLTLTASGNGVISYGTTSVRSSSQSFDVAELSDVVLTVTPDAGHHVETLTVNGENALSQLSSDGKLSIGSMTASVTVAVTFANNFDLTGDGHVDVADIMTIINNIMDDNYYAAADLNNDGFVDVGDIMVVINVMLGIYDNSAGVKAMIDMADTEPVTENNDYLTISNEDNIASIQLDNEFEYSAFQMLITLPDGVDIDAVTFNSNRLDGFTKFVKKVNERQYIIIGFPMNGNVITGSTGKILSLSTTGNTDNNIIISDPIFSIPEAKTYKLRVADSYTTNLQSIQLSQISVRGNTVYIYANSDTTLNIYTISGVLCEQKCLHPGVNTITLRRGQYIINNQKVIISK